MTGRVRRAAPLGEPAPQRPRRASQLVRASHAGRRAGRRPRRATWLRRLATAPIRGYQRTISPALPRRCKYHPTCSAYAVQAVERFGILRGSVLAAWRLLRCNPWSHGGYDPVEAQRLFSSRRAN